MVKKAQLLEDTTDLTDRIKGRMVKKEQTSGAPSKPTNGKKRPLSITDGPSQERKPKVFAPTALNKPRCKHCDKLGHTTKECWRKSGEALPDFRLDSEPTTTDPGRSSSTRCPPSTPIRTFFLHRPRTPEQGGSDVFLLVFLSATSPNRQHRITNIWGSTPPSPFLFFIYLLRAHGNQRGKRPLPRPAVFVEEERAHIIPAQSPHAPKGTLAITSFTRTLHYVKFRWHGPNPKGPAPPASARAEALRTRLARPRRTTPTSRNAHTRHRDVISAGESDGDYHTHKEGNEDDAQE
ncbi:hypothetical protein Taro_029483 [Colocasia esculenta]|uniref:Uncharacterized protein n=1 Tax=Colocasia esculenta TaxID=4460 RepID=A0A843VLH3_COLES|nr:hypothetical protein [Colocasia esculenta]